MHCRVRLAIVVLLSLILSACVPLSSTPAAAPSGPAPVPAPAVDAMGKAGPGTATATRAAFEEASGAPQPERTPPAAAVPATATPQAMRDWETTQVTLDIFSGRENPSWSLTAEQDRELRGLLEPLPEVACRSMDLPLGYRGFVALLAQRPELSNEYRLRVHAGQVRWGAPWDPAAPAVCRADPGRLVERFLLATAQAQLPKDVYAAVASELGPSATPTPAPAAATAAPASGRSLFFARGEDLWCAGLDGQREEQLTRSGVLNWGSADPDTGAYWRSANYRPPSVSPDGRRIALSQSGLDLVRRAEKRDPGPAARRRVERPDRSYCARRAERGSPLAAGDERGSDEVGGLVGGRPAPAAG